MNRYEILYHDRHTEIVDEDTINDLISELESFERTDVSQIHQLNDDDSLGDTIWTEEEGLFPTAFFAKYYGDYDEYTDDVLDVSASEVDDLARDVLGDTEFNIAFDEDNNTVGTNVKTLVVDIISSEYPDVDLGSVPDRVISALENMIEEGYLTEDVDPVTVDWDNLIETADELLDELCAKSDNDDWDDSDGYWSAEVGSEWTMRHLYYTSSLNNTEELKKLCAEYSKKLPNVSFYYFEDDAEEDAVSEIGYVAVNVDY